MRKRESQRRSVIGACSVFSGVALTVGAQVPGSDRYCAMDWICHVRDEPLTGFPSCSARPLARMVQVVNDSRGGQDGCLTVRSSWDVLNLGILTVGTAELPDSAAALWMADLLDAPWSPSRIADPEVARVARIAAAFLRHYAECRPRPAADGTALREEAQAIAWAHTGPGFAVADGAVYSTWLDTMFVAARLTAAAAQHGPAAADEFVRAAISRWHQLAARSAPLTVRT